MGDRIRDLAEQIVSSGASVNGVGLGSADAPHAELSECLRDAGVGAKDIVVLSGLDGRDLLFACVAVWLAGGVPMPTSTSVDPPEVSGACRVTRELEVVPARSSRRVPDAAETAVLHVSSGSTDAPKVALRSHASVSLELEGYQSGLALTGDDQVAVPVPVRHAYGWGVAMSALQVGATLDVEPFVRPGALSKKISSGNVSVLAVTPPLARLLADTAGGPSRLRAVMVGAGPVSDELDAAFEAKFGTPLWRGYGSSETGATFFGRRGMGQPVRGVLVVSPEAGRRGLLCLRLAAAVEGYLGASWAPSHEWDTGDVIERGLDGSMCFIERQRQDLRLNGQFIDARRIEAFLRSIEGVRDVYLVVRPRHGAPEIEDLYALVEGEAERASIQASVATWSLDLPRPKAVTCAAIPRDPIGKPDRARVIEFVSAGER